MKLSTTAGPALTDAAMRLEEKAPPDDRADAERNQLGRPKRPAKRLVPGVLEERLQRLDSEEAHK